MRRLALCPAMFFLVILASGTAQGGRAVAYMQVSATILPWLRYTILEEPGSLDIGGGLEEHHESDHDLHDASPEGHHGERAHEKSWQGPRTLEVEPGTILSITTNTTEGYVLSVQSLPSPVFTVVKVELKESGQSFFLRPGESVALHLPYEGKGTDTLELSYDFTLSTGVAPGSYPWPIVVSVEPL